MEKEKVKNELESDNPVEWVKNDVCRRFGLKVGEKIPPKLKLNKNGDSVYVIDAYAFEREAFDTFIESIRLYIPPETFRSMLKNLQNYE